METENTRTQLAVMNVQLKGMGHALDRIEKGNDKRDDDIDLLKGRQIAQGVKITFFSAIISAIVSGFTYMIGRV